MNFGTWTVTRLSSRSTCHHITSPPEFEVSCLQNQFLTVISIQALLYGGSCHTLSRPADSVEHDFYLTQPFSESTKRARKVPNTMCILDKPKPKLFNPESKRPGVRVEKVAKKMIGSPVKDKPASKSSASSGLDSDMEALQNSLARAEAQKGQYGCQHFLFLLACFDTNMRARTLVVDEIMSKTGGKRKGKLVPTMPRGSSAPRSMPSSPALNAAVSPSLGPTVSASQQALERAKEARVKIIHELAAQDRSAEYLEDKWKGKKDDFLKALNKVADCNSTTKKYTLNKMFWKELDVWSYDYETQELRQKAIDNAVRLYDKLRLSPSEPQWDLLLQKEERGKGKCLSRLQAGLSKASSAAAAPIAQAPKIKVQKAEGATDSSKEDSDAKATPMSRSSSNSLPARKTGDVKKLTTTKKSTTPSRPSPSKPKATQPAAKANDRRVLSQEFVVDSDSDSSDQALAAKKSIQKTKPTSTVTALATTKTTTPAAKPKAKPAPRPLSKTQTTKRPREYEEDEDDSSSSDPPLSKRLKKQPKPQPVKSAAPAPRHRPSDASQNSRGTASGHSIKSKNTSPAKSSPLASSPPTNASDLSQEEETPEPPSMRTPPKKRTISEREKEDRDRARDRHEKEVKRQRREERSLPTALVDKAHKFKELYEQYVELHREVSSMKNPPQRKIEETNHLHETLQRMKKEIYKECSPY